MQELTPIILYVLVPVIGLCAGSFILELADRLPRKEDFIRKRSHCEACGHVLGALDLIPVLSYLFLKGKCRYCGKKLSILLPLAELFCAFLWWITFFIKGITPFALLCALFATALLGLSIIDARTGIIPFGFPVFIGSLAIVRILLECFVSGDLSRWQDALIGAFAVSIPLLVIYYASGGRAIGGGDIKLMTAAGLFLGWKLILLGFVLGCILGAVIHVVRMRFFGASRVLRMGPYLSAGCFLSLLFGEELLSWYFSLF